MMLIFTVLAALTVMTDDKKDREAPMARPTEADDTTPEGAMRALERALCAGDEPKILALTRADTKEQRRALRARCKAWAQIQAFVDALDARFDRDQVNQSFLGLGLMFPTNWIGWDRAKVEVRGDTAVVTDGIHGQKMIREDGHWKAYFDDWDDKTVAKMLAVAEPVAEAMRRTTPEIRAGKYKTLDEVERVFTERARAAGLRNPDDPPPPQPQAASAGVAAVEAATS